MSQPNHEMEVALFRADLQRTGVYPTWGPSKLSRLLWRFKTGADGFTDPLVWQDTVYFGCDKRLYAVHTKTGRLRWCFQAKEALLSSPAISEGTLYCTEGLVSGSLYALDVNTGKQKWQVKLAGGGSCSPAVWQGILYVGDAVNVYAIEARTGQSRWVSQVAKSLGLTSPVLWRNKLFIGYFDEGVSALEALTGKRKWHFPAKEPSSFSVVVDQGQVYCAGGNYLYAVEAESGGERWRLKVAVGRSSPAVWNNVLYAGSLDGALYAVDARSGQLKWRYPTKARIDSSPIVARGIIYFGSADGGLYAVDARTGKMKSRFRIGSAISAVAVWKGVIFVGSEDGYLYAVH